MRQRGLTIVTEVLSGKELDLRDYLNSIGEDIKENSEIRFKNFKTVHFMRWVILPGDASRDIPVQLVLSTNYDGPLDAHLDDVITGTGPALAKIYGFCSNAPKAGTEAWKRYFKAHRRSNAAFYVGATGQRVDGIRKEDKLWVSMAEHLDTEHPSGQFGDLSNAQIQRQLRREAADNYQTEWATQGGRPPFRKWVGPVKLGLGTGGVIAVWIALGQINIWVPLALLAVVIVAVALLWAGLRRAEDRDRSHFQRARRDAGRIADLHAREDHKTQNQITHLVDVKPGFIRQFWLRFVLGAINLLAVTIFNRGSLGGITSIHFARWVIIDKGQRLLFFSNYDGSWESYLGEFVDRAAIGLTGVWSHTKGFPPTKNLIREGARNETAFKAWTRAQQIETQIWYSAYPHRSIKNVLNNTEVHRGLGRDLNEKQASAWLQRL